jgi:hypothetical protein
MAAETKRIGNKPEDKGTYLTRENWEVMKPFVHFAFKAIALIGSATWAIVKFAPRLLAHKEEGK